MGAVPSQLQQVGNKNRLKIVNTIQPKARQTGDNIGKSDTEGCSSVNVLVSITRDKTVVISEGVETGTQTDNDAERPEARYVSGDSENAANEFVLITENSAAPIETTLMVTNGTATVTDNKSSIENETLHHSEKCDKSGIGDSQYIEETVQVDKIIPEGGELEAGDLKGDDENEYNHTSTCISIKTQTDEDDDTGFQFDPYDPSKTGDPIEYETARLERYGKYKVKLSRDTTKCIISAATFLDGGDVIIIDRSNQRIKYIDANFQYISSYDLPHKPWAVCARGGDVYVSMGNTQLQHVFVKDMIIEPERIIEITGRCLGICILGEFIAVGLQIGEISLMDTMGESQKTIKLPVLEKGLPCNPWHMSVTKEENLLVTDSDAESIFCINLDSEVLFTFKMFSSPRGTTVDNQGNIILAGRDKTSGSVVVILSRNFELQRIIHINENEEGRSLLTWAELEFVPYCVAYRPDNVVVLGGIQEALKIIRIVS